MKLCIMVGTLLFFIYIWHFRKKVFSLEKFSSVRDLYPKVHEFLCSYCPLGRMSCIRRYRRNVLSLEQTMAWVLLWCLSGVADICLETIFIHYKEEWSRDTLFWIWNIKGFLANEFLHLLIPLALSIPDQGSENLTNVKFYVHETPVLIPRRPNDQNVCEPAKRSVVQQFMYIKGMVPSKKEEKLPLKVDIGTQADSKRENDPAKNEVPWFESNNAGIVLSIPNLRPQKEILSILYCKLHHQSKYFKVGSALPTYKDEKSQHRVKRSQKRRLVNRRVGEVRSPLFEPALFSPREKLSGCNHLGAGGSNRTLPDLQRGADSALRYSRFTYPDIPKNK